MPVVPEPGLSNDIYPIATMIVKLALQVLIRGSGSELEKLDEDLVADFYFWANRRQEHYADWPPLRFRCDGQTILRCYGVKVARIPNCPVCGQFDADLDVAEEDMQFFAGR
jgi:hypothetical protein